MKKIKKGKGQKGFTLIELLVVVGIMAALAAIIIPNVAKFVGVGQTQGAAAEADAVQAGLDAAIADNGLSAVIPGVKVVNFAIDIDPSTTGTVNLYPTYLRMTIQ